MSDPVVKAAILLCLEARGAMDANELARILNWGPKRSFSSFYNELLELEKDGKVTAVAEADKKMRLWSLSVSGGMDAGVKADG